MDDNNTVNETKVNEACEALAQADKFRDMAFKAKEEKLKTRYYNRSFDAFERAGRTIVEAVPQLRQEERALADAIRTAQATKKTAESAAAVSAMDEEAAAKVVGELRKRCNSPPVS